MRARQSSLPPAVAQLTLVRSMERLALFTRHSRCCFCRALHTRSNMRFSLHHRSIPEKRKHVTSPAAAFSRFISGEMAASSVWTRCRASVILSLMMLLLPRSASGASIQIRPLGSFASLSATSMVHLDMTPLCHVHLSQAMEILSVCSRGTNRPHQSMKPSPTAKQPQRACHDTLPWLIFFSLGSSLTSKGGGAVRWKAVRSLLA